MKSGLCLPERLAIYTVGNLDVSESSLGAIR